MSLNAHREEDDPLGKHNGSAKSIEQKRSIIVFPFWNLEKVENILTEQERNGYRFVGLRWGCRFTFQKSAPRKVLYVISYEALKYYHPFLEWRGRLKSDEYRANPVHRGVNYDIFRITKDDVDLQEFYMERLQYVRRILIQKALLSLGFVLIGIVCMSSEGIPARCATAVGFVALILLILYTFGFIFTFRKKKKR